MRPSHLVPILLYLSCAFNPSDNQQTGIIPYIVVNDTAAYYWYRDSSFNDFIRPAEWGEIIPGEIVIHEGIPNYYDTDFPSVFWGIVRYHFFPDETLSCVKCNCQNISSQVEYDMQWYFDSLNIEWK